MSRAETLFDALQMEAANKRSALAYLDPLLRRARCFVLDDDMSGFLAELATRSFHEAAAGANTEFISSGDGAGVSVTGSAEEVQRVTRKLKKVGDGLRVLAKAPHAVTWMEFDFHKRYDRYLQNFSAFGKKPADGFVKNHRTMYQKCGWLIEQLGDDDYRMTAIQGLPAVGDISVTPFCYRWSTSNDDPKPLHFQGIDGKPFDFSETEGGHDACVARIAFGTPALVDCCEITGNPISKLFPQSEISRVLLEMRGELRYCWSLLAAINDLPLGFKRVERSRGFMARRQYKKFMGYNTISLILPKRMTEQRLARIVVSLSRRRAHEVRGHFRRIGPDKKRVWIKEHIRGDASLGWVSHNYLVKHEEPA